RYDGTETNTTNLELFAGDPSTSQGLGDLNRLIEWHFAATPDAFERNRNQVSISGTTVGGDGSSVKNVNLGRVFVGSAVPAAQANTLNKTGDDGTYYSVTTSGAATSSVTGSFNAFAITTG